MQYYKNIGATNIFIEENSGSNMSSFGYLKCYVIGKLAWNVDVNVSELIDNFFEHYYKDVAVEMRELFDLYNSYFKALDIESDSFEIRIGNYTLNGLWSKNLVDQAIAISENTLKKIDSLSGDVAEKLKNRVLGESVCARYIKLASYRDFGYSMDEYEQFKNEFIQDATKLGVRRVSENVSLEEFIAELD